MTKPKNDNGDGSITLKWEAAIDLRIEISKGKLSGFSAVDSDGNKYDVSFHLKPRAAKNLQLGCYDCQVVGGRMVCRTFPCLK